MRALHVSAHALAMAVLFPAGLALGLALHLGQPMARRFVSASVNRMLAGLLVGRITIDRVGALGLTRLDGVDASVTDASGRRVLRVRGLHARVSIGVLVRSLVSTRRDLVVDVPEVDAERVDVLGDTDEAGALRLANAFQPRPSPVPAGPSGRVLHLTIDRIDVRHLAFLAQPNAPIDGEIRGLHARLRYDDSALDLDVPRGHVLARITRDGSPAAAAASAGPGPEPPPEGVIADGDLRVSLALSPPGALTFHVGWDGALDAVRETFDATGRGDDVDAVLDVARAPPEAVRDLWPASPFLAPVDVHAEVHGHLPTLDVVVRAGLGVGSVQLAGRVEIGPRPTAHVHADFPRFDPRVFLAGAPDTDLTGSADASLVVAGDGALAGHFAIALAEGRWGAVQLPAARAIGDVALPAGGLPRGTAEVVVRERGVPLTASVRLEPKGRALALSFVVQAAVAHLADVVRIGGVAGGRLDAGASGTIDWFSRTFDAQLSARAHDLRAAGITVDDGSGTVHAHGGLGSPAFELTLYGTGLGTGFARFATFRASARAETGGGVVLRDVDADVASAAHTAHLVAAVVRLARGDLEIEGGRVDGLGAPVVGSLRVAPSRITVQAKTEGLKLAWLASFADLPVEAGTLSLDVDGAVQAGAASGRLAAGVEHASLYGVRDASAQVAMTLRGRKLLGRASVTVEDIGHASVQSTTLEIGPGQLVTAAPWRKTWGALQLDAHVDLARLAARLPPGLLARAGLTQVHGNLEVNARLARDDVDDTTPDVDVSLRTIGLVLAGQTASGPWRVDGLRPAVHVTVDGDTGATVLHLEGSDSVGPLVRADLKSTGVPYAALFSDADLLVPLRSTPFDAEIEVPSRPVDSLPRFIPMRGGGALDARMTWHGPVAAPTIDLTARLAGTRGDAGVLAQRVDLGLRARYDGAAWHGKVDGSARGAPVLAADFELRARSADWLASLGGVPMPWRASATARVDRMPLRAFGALYDRDVRGTVTGDVRLDGLHDDARASASLRVDGLEVAGIACRAASARMTIDDRALDASVHVEQSDGRLDAHARLGTRWGAALVPSIDASAPFDASLTSKRFRAALLRPLVGAWLAEIDGRIDADVHMAADPGSQALRPEGTVAYTDGAFELTTFGSDFHDASAKLTFTPDGIVRVSGATARGLSGVVNAAATARLDAAGLVSLRASVRVPSKDPLPVVIDGIPLGQFDGDVDVAIDRASHELDVAVDVPVAHLAVPTRSSSLSAQELGAVPGVEIGIRRAGDDFVPVSLDGAHPEAADPAAAAKTPVRVALRLGSDVHVLRGSGLDVRLEGAPVAVLTDHAAITGQIRMPAGTLQVQGRPFEIERGTVTFVAEDSTNPQIVLTAGWTAPDGTRVYADYVGPLKTAQATLRSSPSRSKNEILALILYGSSDDAASASGGGGAAADTRFAAAAGEAATAPLNQALGGVNRAMESLGLAGGISTKVDTSQANARPEVELQIARDISLQVAWVLGSVPPGTNPDTTLVTVDWRFLRRWSLETTVGDQGTSILNVIWQQRY